VHYKVGSGSFSSRIPTATEPGSYEVSYKVYYDTNNAYLTNKYAPDTSGNFTSYIKFGKFFSDDFAVVSDFAYDGAYHELTTGGPRRQGDVVSYSFTDSVYGLHADNEVLTAKLPGTYDVYYACSFANGTVVTTDICSDGQPDVSTLVKKGTVTVSQGKFFTNDFGLVGDFEYDGQPHVLVTGGPKASGTYALYSTDNSNYGARNVKPTATDVGTYNVYVKPYDVDGQLVQQRFATDGVPTAGTAIGLGYVTVSKATAYLDNSSFRSCWATNISYTGDDLDFIPGLYDNPSSFNYLLPSQFGVFYDNVYFSKDQQNWTSAHDADWETGLGVLWATNRGTYTVYYKVVPADKTRYNESEIYSMTVTIS
jgi:hypothetical protein